MTEQLGPKTWALLEEEHARRRNSLGDRVIVQPRLDERYIAGELPPGSVVRVFGETEYVVGQSGMLMRWEQPIAMSENWRCSYVGRLEPGVWITPRERAEVDEAQP